MTNYEKFQTEYTAQLAKRWNEPDYRYAESRGLTPETLAAKMMPALASGGANKDSASIRATCKACGIKHTYQAIRQYLAQ